MSKMAEGKGNVIVSVRVRPDAGANGSSKTDGEWMVDGRKSLVGYRGKEGGDYYYGMIIVIIFGYETHILQITSLPQTTIMLKYTIPPQNVWCDE